MFSRRRPRRPAAPKGPKMSLQFGPEKRLARIIYDMALDEKTPDSVLFELMCNLTHKWLPDGRTVWLYPPCGPDEGNK